MAQALPLEQVSRGAKALPLGQIRQQSLSVFMASTQAGSLQSCTSHSVCRVSLSHRQVMQPSADVQSSPGWTMVLSSIRQPRSGSVSAGATQRAVGGSPRPSPGTGRKSKQVQVLPSSVTSWPSLMIAPEGVWQLRPV